jgi:cysteinyl-tRNA synthetase
MNSNHRNSTPSEPEEANKQLLLCLKQSKLEEACEQYLIHQKYNARTQFTKRILSEHKKLQDRLNSIANDFTSLMVEEMQKVEDIEQESTRNIQRKQLEEDIIEFMNLQQSLLECFRAAFVRTHD